MQKKANKGEAEKDPFEVPDGSAEELLEYIDGLPQSSPAARGKRV